jgi:hypothetical protein
MPTWEKRRFNLPPLISGFDQHELRALEICFGNPSDGADDPESYP